MQNGDLFRTVAVSPFAGRGQRWNLEWRFTETAVVCQTRT